MTHIERFLATIERRPVDRPATWLGLPTPEAKPGLWAHFGVDNDRELALALDDDVWPVELPYHSPTADAIYMAFDFARKGPQASEDRTLTAPGFFAGCTDPACVDDFDWPDPALYISPDECAQVVADSPPGLALLGVIWSAHFQDACAAFGMEAALMAAHDTPEVFRAVIDRIAEFYLRANGIFYEATRGRLHAILIGNDFGSQTGLMVSPGLLREFVLPGTRRLIAQAKDYGLKVFHHSCGSICPIIPDLIAAGADVIHPLQALAEGMSAEAMHEQFGGQVSFCGAVDVQELMVHGTPEEVGRRVRQLRALFPTGLILSPSHEAILPDVPPANVAAMFAAAHEQ
jgi:uroporphyrinogen decarboxylase